MDFSFYKNLLFIYWCLILKGSEPEITSVYNKQERACSCCYYKIQRYELIFSSIFIVISGVNLRPSPQKSSGLRPIPTMLQAEITLRSLLLAATSNSSLSAPGLIQISGIPFSEKSERRFRATLG